MNRVKYVVCILALMFSAVADARYCPEGFPRTAPDERYVDNGDGTVTDVETGLMWKQCTEVPSSFEVDSGCRTTPDTMTWDEAVIAAENEEFAGYSDWRLPNVKELASLVELGCYAPAINVNAFPVSMEGSYWTSSPANDSSYDESWSVHFKSGISDTDLREDRNYVRFVRGGN